MHLTRKASASLFIVAVAALCTIELWVATSPAFVPNTAFFAFVVTADLLLGIPFLFYTFVVRPYRLSPTTIGPIFLLAVVIAGYILPPSGRNYLDMAKILVPLIELALFCVCLWKIRTIYQHYRHARHTRIYFTDALETSIHSTFGNNPFIKLLTIEFSLIFLAFFGWFMKFSVLNAQDNSESQSFGKWVGFSVGASPTAPFPSHLGSLKVFTYHRKSLYPIIFLVFLLLIVVETIGLHLLIQHWSPLVAWILTGLSIYSLFWIIGDFNALRLHPIVFAGDILHLRSGLRWSATLPLADIVDVQTPKQSDAKSRDYLSFARAGEARIVLELKQPVRVHGLFGIEKEVSRIGLFLDDMGAFRVELDQRRQTLQEADT